MRRHILRKKAKWYFNLQGAIARQGVPRQNTPPRIGDLSSRSRQECSSQIQYLSQIRYWSNSTKMTKNTETAMLSQQIIYIELACKRQTLNLNLTFNIPNPSYSFATFPNKASRLLESLKQSPEYEESIALAFIMFQMRTIWNEFKGFRKVG